MLTYADVCGLTFASVASQAASASADSPILYWMVLQIKETKEEETKESRLHSPASVVSGSEGDKARGTYIYICICVCVCVFVCIISLSQLSPGQKGTRREVPVYMCVCVCVCVCV